MYYRVLVASERYHGTEALTYESEAKLQNGQIVSVPLQRRTALGIVTGVSRKPAFATKPITTAWEYLIPGELLELHAWFEHYYPAPIGLITELFTPANLVAKPRHKVLGSQEFAKPTLPPLSDDQTTALEQIAKMKTGSVLLHGDTGTGKTRVYLELARKTLDSQKSVIILTPEIGLTEPLLQTFSQIFGDQVVVTHSQMTIAERREVWVRAATSEQPLLVVGPRSALFTPLRNIGLIVMDEAHDSAYKQEQAPYYQTSRVAAQLASLHQALFVMGSATPSINDYFVFTERGLPILRMKQLAAGEKQPVDVEIIDQRDKNLFRRSPWLSTTLLEAMEQAVSSGQQVLLFLNRRGSARLVLCHNCGWQATCPHCDTSLTYHQDNHQMRCHSCNYSGTVPTNCPECGAHELVFRSIGTKALETEVARLFPSAHVSRFDRDTEDKQSIRHQHADLVNGKVQIIIGTQAIAKGFDLPKLAVVGIIQADASLQFPDYSASERTFQLISQVSGRIGRGYGASKLFIQTYNPNNPLLRLAVDRNYEHFYQTELEQRRLYSFPPFVYLLKLTCSRASSASARAACNQLADTIRRTNRNIIVEGPSPRFVEKIAGKYAWHLILKAKNRSALLDVIKSLPANIFYDLDPSDLL